MRACARSSPTPRSSRAIAGSWRTTSAKRSRRTDFARSVTIAARADAPPIVALERGDEVELSFAQQRLWFLGQLDGIGSAYHLPIGLRLAGTLDAAALRGALDRIVARHEALRTTF